MVGQSWVGWLCLTSHGQPTHGQPGPTSAQTEWGRNGVRSQENDAETVFLATRHHSSLSNLLLPTPLYEYRRTTTVSFDSDCVAGFEIEMKGSALAAMK